MFDQQFFPTPVNVIEQMIEGIDLAGKIIYEPQAGKGDIVDYCQSQGAQVIASELHPQLRLIVSSKCKVIAEDCMKVSSDMISHVDAIIMNPPFKEAAQHILHLYEVAPPGCIIRALCASSNIANPYTKERKQLCTLIENFGDSIELGNCFEQAERYTQVEVTLIRLQKAGENYTQEFEGFFLEADEEEQQANGIMPYNVVRDLVNRYVEAVKIYDDQLETAVRLNKITAGFFGGSIGFQCTSERYQANRNEYKKDLQKAGWLFIFKNMNLDKYATRGLKEDINKFVEQQQHIPFTMRNIYRMLEIVAGTTSQRIDKALLEVFDKITKHHAENHYYVKGWKTNSHFLIGKKFILPNMTTQDRWSKGSEKIDTGYGGHWDTIEDLVKALCYITGDKFDALGDLKQHIRYDYKITTDDHVYYCNQYEYETRKQQLYQRGVKIKTEAFRQPLYGEWFEWAYFRCKAHKAGSMHFEFLNEDVWALFNQRIAKIKGYPLFEGKKQTRYQDRQTGRATQEKSHFAYTKSQVLF